MIARFAGRAGRVVEDMLHGGSEERGPISTLGINLERGIPRIVHVRRSS